MALQQIGLPHVAPGAQDYVFYYDCWCLAANRVQNPRCKGFNTSLFLSPRQLGSTTTVVFFIASGLVSLWSCEMLVVVLSCLTCNKKLTGAGDGLVFDLWVKCMSGLWTCQRMSFISANFKKCISTSLNLLSGAPFYRFGDVRCTI